MSHPPRPISRRALLAAGAGLATAGSLQARQGILRESAPDLQGGRPARNIVFLVSDGCSTGTLSLADSAIRARTGTPSWWTRLWSTPGARRAVVGTSAADSLVTDSAAGGSAWGIGSKVNNGAVNIRPDGSSATPVLVAAKARGLRGGLVTTTRLTDATPASFAANVPKRSMEDAVATQLLERGIDLLLGGGGRHFREAELEAARATVVHSRKELLALPAERRSAAAGPLVGLFADGSMAFEIDRLDTQPSLAEMTQAALGHLAAATDGAEQGFILQVEGGRVDHAAHGNDAAALVRDQMAFDEAIGVAVEFARSRAGDGPGDTLLIVTTDHGNANPGLTVYGQAGRAGMTRLLAARHSFEWILQRLGGLRDPAELADDLPGVVRDAMGVELTPREIDWVRRRLVERQSVNGFSEADTAESALGAVLANHFGVAFLSVNHTSDLVDCVAWGPGAERLEPVIENTALHTLMCEAVGLGAGR